MADASGEGAAPRKPRARKPAARKPAAKTPARPRAPKLTAAQKVQRDLRVIEMRARGRAWPKIAEDTGLSVETCKRVHAQYLRDQVPILGRRLPEDFIVEVLDEIESIIEDMAEIRQNAPSANEKVAAARTQLQASKSKVEFLQALGLMPTSVGAVATAAEFRKLVFDIVGILHDAKMPPEVEQRILEVATRGSGGKPTLEIVKGD